MEIFHERGAAHARFQGIVIVGDAEALVGRQGMAIRHAWLFSIPRRNPRGLFLPGICRCGA
jgi:hypothetical protein